MKKTGIILACSVAALCAKPAMAKEGFNFDHELNIRNYYGISQVKKDMAKNLPNRVVNRNDLKASLEYDFANGYKVGIHNNSSLIFRQHDNAYANDGEWRFYNFGVVTTPAGTVIAGQDFNVAQRFHMGAKDTGPMGISDTNMTWFLTDPNWTNGKKSVAYYTPKSTAMIDDGRAVKFNYISPKVFGNTLFGFTYTPDTPNRRGMISRYNNYKHEDAYVFAMHNEWELDFGDLYTSAGYGFFNRNYQVLTLGTTLEVGNWSYATGYRNSFTYGDEPIAQTGTSSLPAFFDNYRDSWAWDASVGYKFGPFKTSVAYLHTEAKKTTNKDDLVIWSNTYSYNKHLDIYLIGGYLKAKGMKNSAPSKNNEGYAAIAGFAINL